MLCFSAPCIPIGQVIGITAQTSKGDPVTIDSQQEQALSHSAHCGGLVNESPKRISSTNRSEENKNNSAKQRRQKTSASIRGNAASGKDQIDPQHQQQAHASPSRSASTSSSSKLYTLLVV